MEALGQSTYKSGGQELESLRARQYDNRLKDLLAARSTVPWLLIYVRIISVKEHPGWRAIEELQAPAPT